MLHEYLYAIIALIIFLTSIVIYFLTRRFNQESQNLLNDTKFKHTNIMHDPYNKQEKLRTKTDTENETEVTFVLQDYEEGSFGHLDKNPFEDTSNQEKKPSKKL